MNKSSERSLKVLCYVSEAGYMANELGWQCGLLSTLIVPKTDFKTAAWFCNHLHHHHRPQCCIIIALKKGSTHLSWICTTLFSYIRRQGGTTCGAIGEARRSLKSIDKRIVMNFCDENAVITRFHDSNVFLLFEWQKFDDNDMP